MKLRVVLETSEEGGYAAAVRQDAAEDLGAAERVELSGRGSTVFGSKHFAGNRVGPG